MRIDPTLTLVIILAIGIVAGLIFDRIAGPGWLTRQIAGSTRGMVTSSLVGIAGAFIGYHLVALAAAGYAPFAGAIVGAALVLWVWRMMR
ncbi:MAG: transglycosylase [Pseudorhodoplanes sp.]|uniref:transglycosylase n=1 Tax=Pseudorhodoplanes sp. TaxID=1934341 RepID=UPI003D13E0F6